MKKKKIPKKKMEMKMKKIIKKIIYIPFFIEIKTIKTIKCLTLIMNII